MDHDDKENGNIYDNEKNILKVNNVKISALKKSKL